MHRNDVLHPDFRLEPYWWDSWRPSSAYSEDPVPKADVVVIGGGYAGLSAALELSRCGGAVVVVEASDFGAGASTRNGGAASGAIALSKVLGRIAKVDPKGVSGAQIREMMQDAERALDHVETIIERENINCSYKRAGLFIGAHTDEHYRQLVDRLKVLTDFGQLKVSMITKTQQRDEVDCPIYRGGATIESAGKLHPALYYKGLLDSCHRHGTHLSGRTTAHSVQRITTGFEVSTNKGSIQCKDLVIATNGYTGHLSPFLQRRIVPVATQIIVTEVLPNEIVSKLIPHGRNVSDTRRLPNFYRVAPDSNRLLFGGRANYKEESSEADALVLHRAMLEHFPQLRGFRVTHSWGGKVAFTSDLLPHMGVTDGMHYCIGCNGSGVAMMSYLGQQIARKVLTGQNRTCSFDGQEFQPFPVYTRFPGSLSAASAWYSLRDRYDRWRAA